MSKTKLPVKMGRPTKYNDELADRICAALAEGQSMHAIAGQDGIPSEPTIYAWLDLHEDFLKKYLIAREIAADRLVAEIVPIADGEMPVLNKLDDGTELSDLDTAVRVSRDTARIKARMWKAGRMSPRKWGERLEQNDMGAIRPPIVVIHSSADVRPGAAPKADRGKGHNGD